jgi:hypothetical protein
MKGQWSIHNSIWHFTFTLHMEICNGFSIFIWNNSTQELPTRVDLKRQNGTGEGDSHLKSGMCLVSLVS